MFVDHLLKDSIYVQLNENYILIYRFSGRLKTKISHYIAFIRCIKNAETWLSGQISRDSGENMALS